MAGQPREQSQPALAPEPEMPEEAKGRGYDGRNPSGRGGHEEGGSSRERDPPGLGPSRKDEASFGAGAGLGGCCVPLW